MLHVIFFSESVDPVADLCLTNQIYSVLLYTLNSKKSQEITEVQNTTLKCFLKMAKRELAPGRCCTCFPKLYEECVKSDYVLCSLPKRLCLWLPHVFVGSLTISDFLWTPHFPFSAVLNKFSVIRRFMLPGEIGEEYKRRLHIHVGIRYFSSI